MIANFFAKLFIGITTNILVLLSVILNIWEFLKSIVIRIITKLPDVFSAFVAIFDPHWRYFYSGYGWQYRYENFYLCCADNCGFSTDWIIEADSWYSEFLLAALYETIWYVFFNRFYEGFIFDTGGQVFKLLQFGYQNHRTYICIWHMPRPKLL